MAHARRVTEEGEQRSGISQLHFAAKPSSGLSVEEGRRSWRCFALGRFPSLACLLPASSSANFVLGLANAARGRTTSSRPLVGMGGRMGFIGLASAERPAPWGLLRAELRRQSKRSPSPTCSVKQRETPALLVTPRPWTGSEI